LAKLANEDSSLGDHIREGVVVKPVKERWNERVGRVIMKYIGEEYELKKDKKKGREDNYAH